MSWSHAGAEGMSGGAAAAVVCVDGMELQVDLMRNPGLTKPWGSPPVAASHPTHARASPFLRRPRSLMKREMNMTGEAGRTGPSGFAQGSGDSSGGLRTPRGLDWTSGSGEMDGPDLIDMPAVGGKLRS